MFSFSLVSFTLKPTKEIRHAVVGVKLRTCILKHWVFLPLMGEGVWEYVGFFWGFFSIYLIYFKCVDVKVSDSQDWSYRYL